MVKVFFFNIFSDRLFCSRPNSKIKKSIFRFLFYFTLPTTPQKRPEDGMSTKRSIVPRLISAEWCTCTCISNIRIFGRAVHRDKEIKTIEILRSIKWAVWWIDDIRSNNFFILHTFLKKVSHHFSSLGPPDVPLNSFEGIAKSGCILEFFNSKTVSKITYVTRFLGSVWTPMLAWTSDPWKLTANMPDRFYTGRDNKILAQDFCSIYF